MPAGQLEAAIRLGMATDPARRPPRPASWWSACAAAGRPGCPPASSRCAARTSRLPRLRGNRPRGDGPGACPPRRADRGRGRGQWRPLVRHWATTAPPCRSSTRPPWPSRPSWRRSARSRRSRGPRTCASPPLGHPHRRAGAPRRGLRRAGDGDRGAGARAGGRRPDPPLQVTSELVAGHLGPGCSLVDLGPHRLTPARPSTSSRSPGPDRGAATGDDLPVPRPARLPAGRRAVLLRPRARRRRHPGAPGPRPAPGRGRRLREREVLAPACRRHRRRPRRRVPGIADAALVTPGADPALDADDDDARLLVVDQFEELFTACDDPARRAVFVDALLRRRGPVVVGLRADVYGRLGAHPRLAHAVAREQVCRRDDGRGARARRDGAGAARRPQARAGSAGAGRARRRVGAGALPLLSHALRATWERREAGRRPWADTAPAAASLGHRAHADAVVDALPDDQRALARDTSCA